MALETSALEALRETEGLIMKAGGDDSADIKEVHDNDVTRLFEKGFIAHVLSASRSSDEDKYGEDYRHPDFPFNPKKSSDRGFNTTTHLIFLAEKLAEGDQKTAEEVVGCIKKFTLARLGEELEDADEAVRDRVMTQINDVCFHFLAAIEAFDPEAGDSVYLVPGSKDYYIKKVDGILIPISGFGEILIRDIHLAARPDMEGLVLEKGYKATPVEGDPDFPEMAAAAGQAKVAAVLKAAENPALRLVAPGHCLDTAGRRGYTELETIELGAALAEATGKSVGFVIAKQYPIMSKDPTAGGKAKVVERISRGMAQELFGEAFGADAGAIQPSALDMALRKDIDIFVLNKSNVRDGQITRISDFEAPAGGVEIVSKKDTSSITVRHTMDMPRGRVSELVRDWSKINDTHYFDRDGKVEGSSTFHFAGNFDEGYFGELEASINKEFGERVHAISSDTARAAIYQLGNNMGRPGVSAAVGRAYAEADINILGQLQGDSPISMRQFVQSRDADKAVEAIHLLSVETDREDLRRMTDDDIRDLFKERGIL